MAEETKKNKTVSFGLEIEYDEELEGKPFRIWLFQLANRIGYEHKVTKVIFGNKEKTITDQEQLKSLKLRKQEDL